jgi:hypothetical protein
MDLLRKILRIPGARGLWARFPIGPVEAKVRFGVHDRPHYAYGVYWAAVQAKQLRIPRITAIELGVAGGRGLVALERICAEVSAALEVDIAVVGFDSGAGMPPPLDYRDLPHVWNEGFYKMDEALLRSRLRSAKLALGDVATTTKAWLQDGIEAPIGFVAFDLDYYSSTRDAFALFEGGESTHLPRALCYFDDLCPTDIACMSTYVGEYLAIDEFNRAHERRKIAKIENLRANRPYWERWQDRMYAFHDFAHSRYPERVIPHGDRYDQLPL